MHSSMIIQITCADLEPIKLVDNGLATSLALSGGQVRTVHQGADFFGEIGIVSCLVSCTSDTTVGW